MLDPVSIATLIAVIFNGISQVVQMILDYKKNQRSGHGEIYEMKNFQSNCCSNFGNDSDEPAPG